MSKTLIVIPVRGGSQGIPNKAIRSLGGIAPLVRTIRTAKQLPADTVVITDDLLLADLVWDEGAVVCSEPATLNPQGTKPLDVAVHYALMARPDPHQYNTVVTMQATSPFTSVETVRKCVSISQELDTTVLTVRDDRGLRWSMGALEPHLTTRAPRRITRQNMEPCWKETGAVFATPRRFVSPEYRFATTAYLLPVEGREAIDLDAPEDWAVAEWYAGAPSTRECLMARVLGDRYPMIGLICQLSAWDEDQDDSSFRDAMRFRLSGLTLRLQGANTYDEAASVNFSGQRDVLILTSAYHQVRAFLTFLKVLQETGLDRTVHLWNVPAASRMDKLAGEWQKIATYQAKGHVASLEDGLSYLDWRDRQQMRLIEDVRREVFPTAIPCAP